MKIRYLEYYIGFPIVLRDLMVVLLKNKRNETLLFALKLDRLQILRMAFSFWEPSCFPFLFSFLYALLARGYKVPINESLIWKRLASKNINGRIFIHCKSTK